MPRSPRSFRVLVIDDEPVVRDLIACVLGEEGFHVVALPSATEALRVALSEPFDGVVCDQNLPGMGGLEFLAALERAGRSFRGRAILVTGEVPGSRAVARAVDSGEVRLLAKPFSIAALARLTCEITGRPAAAPEPA